MVLSVFFFRNGPFPLMYYQWHMTEYYIQLCLAGLKDVDRLVLSTTSASTSTHVPYLCQPIFGNMARFNFGNTTSPPPKVFG